MAGQLSVQPPVLDLSFYAGDGVSFKLTCKDATNAPINLTGTVEAQVRVDRVTEGDPVLAFFADLTDAASGIVVLSLTGEETEGLIDGPTGVDRKGNFSGVWDAQWTAFGSEPKTLCQGKVECLTDVTR
jgi:hypothetical protein